MRLTRLWISLTLVFIVSFAILGYYGGEIYQTMPPVPKRVVTSTGKVLFTEKEIKDGQNVWQSMAARNWDPSGDMAHMWRQTGTPTDCIGNACGFSTNMRLINSANLTMR